LKCLRTSSSESSGRLTSFLLRLSGTRAFPLAHSSIFGSEGGTYPILPFPPSSERRGSSQNACLNFLPT